MWLVFDNNILKIEALLVFWQLRGAALDFGNSLASVRTQNRHAIGLSMDTKQDWPATEFPVALSRQIRFVNWDFGRIGCSRSEA